MNRLFRILIIVLVIGTVLQITAFAATSDSIQPLYTDTCSVYATISFNPLLGTATCYGKVQANDNYPVKVICYLQQRVNGEWVTLGRWEKSGTVIISVSGTRAIYSGYEYRAYVTGIVYDANGDILEVSYISDTKSYP